MLYACSGEEFVQNMNTPFQHEHFQGGCETVLCLNTVSALHCEFSCMLSKYNSLSQN